MKSLKVDASSSPDGSNSSAGWHPAAAAGRSGPWPQGIWVPARPGAAPRRSVDAGPPPGEEPGEHDEVGGCNLGRGRVSSALRGVRRAGHGARPHAGVNESPVGRAACTVPARTLRWTDPFVETVKRLVVERLEIDAGQFLTVEFFGKLVCLNPRRSHNFEGECKTNADIANAELSHKPCQRAIERSVGFWDVGTRWNPSEACFRKTHGAIPIFHRNHFELTANFILFVEK